MVRKIYDDALTRSRCYENLRVLCKTIGHRISGSPQAENAVQWGKKTMEAYGYDKIWLQDVMVPHWVRGTKEKAAVTIMKNPKVKDGSSKSREVKITALGGTIGTNGIIQGELVEIRSFDDFKTMSPDKLKGKIAFFNIPMEPKVIQTFQAYGGCVSQRVEGAIEASKFGASGIIIRSVTHSHDNHPHTGSMRYDDSVRKIPAAAISTETADLIAAELRKGNRILFSFDMDCKLLPDVPSHNVIGELTGSVHPERIITIGGHLDSWDIGEGAHDDGAGCVQSMEVLNLLKLAGYKPKNTIRAVLFMNEENGLRGGKKYAEEASAKNEKHIAALESDRGGFTPRGFSVQGDEKYLSWLRKYEKLFAPYDVHLFEKGYGGADIGPLKNYYKDVVLFGFIPDSQRYFDFHHAETDVFEAVNKRELELGAAAMAVLIYLVDSQLFNQ
jgi:carboxypeptidase Q